MYYKKKPVVVEATKLTADLVLNEIYGQSGDWLMIDELGHMQFLTEEKFQHEYEAADEDEYPTRFKDMPKKERKPRAPRKGKNGIAPAAKSQLGKDFDAVLNDPHHPMGQAVTPNRG